MTARPPWLRALNECYQRLSAAEDGMLPEVAFERLVASLEPEQVEALAWLMLADVAVWPQLSVADASTVSSQQSTDFDTAPYPARELALAAQAFALDLDPIPAWKSQCKVMRLARDPGWYWDEWLRRVVPQAITTPPAEAQAFARGALASTVATPDRWNYEAGMLESSEIVISGVSPDVGGQEFIDFGIVERVAPQNRQISATYRPKVPTDTYRMGYFLQTTILSAFIQRYEGQYSAMEITNLDNGEVWSGVRY